MQRILSLPYFWDKEVNRADTDSKPELVWQFCVENLTKSQLRATVENTVLVGHNKARRTGQVRNALSP